MAQICRVASSVNTICRSVARKATGDKALDLGEPSGTEHREENACAVTETTVLSTPR